MLTAINQTGCDGGSDQGSSKASRSSGLIPDTCGQQNQENLLTDDERTTGVKNECKMFTCYTRSLRCSQSLSAFSAPLHLCYFVGEKCRTQ